MKHWKFYKTFSLISCKETKLAKFTKYFGVPIYFYKVFVYLVFLVPLCETLKAQRKDVLINENWQSKLLHSNAWETVNVPHNWDQYYGYRRMLHGNLHDTAIYKRNVFIQLIDKNKNYQLQFEGVGSYAIVKINGVNVGQHNGGRTSFTVNVSNAIKRGNNLIEVQAAHPANINDLPWVCGGCSSERGFSEGSQPLGIFRNVHFITTSNIAIVPFGVYTYANINNNAATINSNITIKNYVAQNKTINIKQYLVNKEGKIISQILFQQNLNSFDSIVVKSPLWKVSNLQLWSLKNPYLYKIITKVFEANKLIDEIKIDFGFRTIKWAADKSKLFINDEQVFVNGIAEYEHLMGNSHSFSDAQINSRIKWITNAGFNAFRDAHQPHNLLYGKLLNQKGLLWWSQFSAHIWYDTDVFKNNFKALLKDWVLERRNDPALFMWGIQNESKLPKEFTEECTEIIRSLDATASTQRLITTCNGGTGADWDVPQNWSGTYGGDINNYGNELKKQKLVGEYGAWRTLGLHNDDLNAEGYTEEKACNIIETKIRKANEVKDSVVGHFFWLFNSHENPGRVQGGEGVREIDRVGPINYKGLLTAWEEPTDLYYLFQSNYTDNKKKPMVYIVSHTDAKKWDGVFSAKKVNVYSNCDSVELFSSPNQYNAAHSYGVKKNMGIGYHFSWNEVLQAHNSIIAIGYVNGSVVATDTLYHLNSANETKNDAPIFEIIKPDANVKYILQYNFGGNVVKDAFDNIWLPDEDINETNKNYGTSCWSSKFAEMPKTFASQRTTPNDIGVSPTFDLFKTFRYSNKNFKFYLNDIENGIYYIDLFFKEPWIKTANGIGMRLFDIAINDSIYLKDFDIFKEANGYNKVLKKTLKVNVINNKIQLSFPNVKVGQALINAIRIATLKSNKTKPINYKNTQLTSKNICKFTTGHWMDQGSKFNDTWNNVCQGLPNELIGTSWIEPTHCNQSELLLQPSLNLILYVVTSNDSFCKANGWQQLNDRFIVGTYSNCNFFVFKKEFNKQDLVAINRNGVYLIAYKPTNRMQPAFDLKLLKQYKANVALITDNVIKDSVQGRICANVQNNDTTTLTFPIEIGAADIYSFTTKYYYALGNNLNATMQIKDANGVVYLNEKINFNNTKKGKWNQFTVNTNSMINAGKYFVTFNFSNAASLAINGIDVQ